MYLHAQRTDGTRAPRPTLGRGLRMCQMGARFIYLRLFPAEMMIDDALLFVLEHSRPIVRSPPRKIIFDVDCGNPTELTVRWHPLLGQNRRRCQS